MGKPIGEQAHEAFILPLSINKKQRINASRPEPANYYRWQQLEQCRFVYIVPPRKARDGGYIGSTSTPPPCNHWLETGRYVQKQQYKGSTAKLYHSTEIHLDRARAQRLDGRHHLFSDRRAHRMEEAVMVEREAPPEKQAKARTGRPPALPRHTIAALYCCCTITLLQHCLTTATCYRH